MPRVQHSPVVVLSLCALFGALASPRVAAQEFRGTVTGRVSDTTGGMISGVTVTVTNVETGVAMPTTTNETGSYTVPYVMPGTYRIDFELMSFRKVSRTVEIRVGDRVEVNAALEPGAVSETVQVTAETPLLETTTGSVGQVIDEQRIASLPLADGNPFVLARFAAGIMYHGDLKFSRPFDNQGTSDITADGAPGANEFTLDGSPNLATGKRVAYVPPSDQVKEFKVESSSYDAQQGHTAGASVNVVMKSGTNEAKGDAYGFLRSDKLAANDFFLNRTGTPNPGLNYEHWGGVAGGPIQRNRTFFFTGFERLTDRFPEPGPHTVPTLAERQGDFSAMLPLGIIIYDPRTAVDQGGGRIARSPFEKNVIPRDRLSPIALNYLRYYPLPNQPGDAQGRNNYFSPAPRTDVFYSESYRTDHQVTDRQRFFARYYRNHRREDRGNWSGVTSGIRATGNYLYRVNDGLSGDHVYTLSSRTLLDLRGGWTRFQEFSVREHEGAVAPASLGFSPETASLFPRVSYLPRFDISGSNGPFSPLGEGLGGGTTLSVYSFQPTLTRLLGSHSIRVGYDFRLHKEYSNGPGNAAGSYTFGTNYTKQSSSSPSAPIGQELASFLLGMPTGGSIDINTDRLNYSPYHAVFVQDDWRATGKLTVNLGLRYEYEGATTERLNRNLRGFDDTTPSPIEPEAVAAYAANPNPALPPENFDVIGGLTFADDENRAFWNAETKNVQPRVGFAYSATHSTVIRGGIGLYSVPFIISAVHRNGFSHATPIVPTLDGGLTFVANLADPFPDGLQLPPGSGLGLATDLGRAVTIVPLDRRQERALRWSIGIQRQLPGSWVIEASYVGNHGYDLTTTLQLNEIPAQFLSTSPTRDQERIDFISQRVANPFRGLIPGVSLNGSTTSLGQLLRPFPQFTPSGSNSGVESQAYDGSSQYHAAQFRVERRFHQGYTLLANYTWSHATTRTSKLNATDADYEDRLSGNDVPHRLTLSGIWELPFGRGHALGGGSAWASALAGGWSVQVLGQAQSGRPLSLGNVYFNGDPRRLHANISSSTLDHTFDTSGFYFHDAAVQTNGVDDPVKQLKDERINLSDNIRTLPSRFDNFRGQPLTLWDISAIKRFPITSRVKMQLNVELINAFNHVHFSDPSLSPRNAEFGKINSQSNLPREVQLAAKLLF